MGFGFVHRLLGLRMIPILIGVCLSSFASAQTRATQVKTRGTSPNGDISRFFIEQSKKDSRYETGPLHIIYSDGTETVKTLPPLAKSTDKETVFNDVGFSSVQLAEDQQTIGWTVDVENCCTSYAIPLRVVIFRHGKVLHVFAPGQMVWNWMFLLGGKRLAVVSGATHGPEVGTYRLYDVQTGKLISEVIGDEDTQSLKPDAPEWAQLLQKSLHNQ